MDKLTPQEEAELATLEAEQLTPEEQAELSALESGSGNVYSGPVGPNPAPNEPGFVENLQQRLGDQASPEGISKSANLAGSMLGLGAPNLVSKGASKLAQFLGRTSQEAVVGAATSPEDRITGAALGAVTSLGGEAVKAGGSKVADYAMQMAAGMPKYIKGVGNTLAKQGLWGTEGMLENQVGKKMTEQGRKAASIAARADSGIGPGVDTGPMAAKIRERFVQPNTLKGQAPSSLDRPALDEASDYARNLEKLSLDRRGNTRPMSYTDALTQRKNEGRRAYSLANGQMKLNQSNQLAGEGQAQLSRELKRQLGEDFASSDEAYTALSHANRALEKDDTLPKGALSLANKAIGAIPLSSAVQSTIGRTGNAFDEYAAPAAKTLFRAERTSKDKGKK